MNTEQMCVRLDEAFRGLITLYKLHSQLLMLAIAHTHTHTHTHTQLGWRMPARAQSSRHFALSVEIMCEN